MPDSAASAFGASACIRDRFGAAACGIVGNLGVLISSEGGFFVVLWGVFGRVLSLSRKISPLFRHTFPPVTQKNRYKPPIFRGCRVGRSAVFQFRTVPP